MNPEEYSKLVKKKTPPSAVVKNSVKAFIVGGIICTIGQLFMNLYKKLGLDQDSASTATSITLIFISALLTGLDIYPKIAKFGGAGTLVPITGFANAVASPALESKPEGAILGTGSKIFTIAGPVILYGTLASSVCGFIYWCIQAAG